MHTLQDTIQYLTDITFQLQNGEKVDLSSDIFSQNISDIKEKINAIVDTSHIPYVKDMLNTMSMIDYSTPEIQTTKKINSDIQYTITSAKIRGPKTNTGNLPFKIELPYPSVSGRYAFVNPFRQTGGDNDIFIVQLKSLVRELTLKLDEMQKSVISLFESDLQKYVKRNLHPMNEYDLQLTQLLQTTNPKIMSIIHLAKQKSDIELIVTEFIPQKQHLLPRIINLKMMSALKNAENDWQSSQKN